MRRTFVLSLGVLAVLALTTALTAQQAGQNQTALMRITVPENARVEIDGFRTKATGGVRLFESPPLVGGKKYTYNVKATWTKDGKDIVQEQTVTVEAGKTSEVNLTQAAPAKAGGETKKTDTPVVEPAKNDQEKKKPRREPDVIFVPTPQPVVDKMLEVAGVKKDDILYDLGCGDGRIPVTAAKKFGCKAWGFDIDPQRIKESNENVKKNDVGKLVTIEDKDIFTLDLSKATVVTLYLLPELNVKLIPQLEKMKPGSRIVSHDFDMAGVKPDKHITVKVNGDTKDIYLWTIPLKKEKP